MLREVVRGCRTSAARFQPLVDGRRRARSGCVPAGNGATISRLSRMSRAFIGARGKEKFVEFDVATSAAIEADESAAGTCRPRPVRRPSAARDVRGVDDRFPRRRGVHFGVAALPVTAPDARGRPRRRGQIRGPGAGSPRSGGDRWRASLPRYGRAVVTSTRVEQPQRQLGVVTLLIRRVRQLLHVEVGQDAQQRRPHIDTAAQSEMGRDCRGRTGLRFP